MTNPIEIKPTSIPVGSIHANTDLALIQITEDKLRLTFHDYLSKCEQKNRWHVPASILFTLIPVLLTSDFKDTGFVTKAEWKAFFSFCAFGSLIWLVVTLRQAFTTVTVEELVNKIKNPTVK